MLVSKKHAKSPPEKPISKISKISHIASNDPFVDTDDESEATQENSSNIHHPKVVDHTARRIKISYRSTGEDDTFHLKHIEFLKQISLANENVSVIYNKRHEILRYSALEDLKNVDIYKNHFDLHQVTYGKNQEFRIAIVIQDFDSKLKTHEMKRQLNLIPFLKQNKLRIIDHEWDSATWNTRLIGFLPVYSPTHFPKEYVYQRMISLVKHVKEIPDFRVRHIWMSDEVLGKRFSVQVYAIEVKNTDFNQANKIFLQSAESVDEYISFRTKSKNEKAFKNAIALVAQIQNDSRIIIIENVSEEAFFVYDAQLQKLSDTVGYYHLPKKARVHIVVQLEDYQNLRRLIQQEINDWNSKLDPSDIRYTGKPVMVPINADEYSSSSELDGSIGSLMSIDLTSFTVFTTKTTTNTGESQEPTSDLTLESHAATIAMQNARIEKQEAQIELLISTIKNMNEDVNRKLERMYDFFTQVSANKQVSSPLDEVSSVEKGKEDTIIGKESESEKEPQVSSKQTTKSPMPKRVVGSSNRRTK